MVFSEMTVEVNCRWRNYMFEVLFALLAVVTPREDKTLYSIEQKINLLLSKKWRASVLPCALNGCETK